MTIFISPSVSTSETDLTLSVVEKSDVTGAMAGYSTWGAADEPTLLTSGEDELLSRFGKPNDQTALHFFVAADYLGYTPKMWFTRVVGANARNATVGGGGVLVKNQDALERANISGIPFIAKYPGSLGNGLTVSVMDGGDAWDKWEFRDAFTYKPQSGEFAIAVIDGSGNWTGVGASKQVERLVVDGKVYGGSSQRQKLLFAGAAQGGVKQEETLTVVGVASSAALNVDGVSVVLTPGDDSITVAQKVAAALGASPRYLSATALSNRVKVVFATPATQSKINDVDQSGIVISSRIDVTGNDQFRASLYGENLTLRLGDTAVAVAQKFKAIMDFDTAKYANVEMVEIPAEAEGDPATAELTYSYVEPGSKATTPTQDLGGTVVTTTVVLPGDSAVMIQVLGYAVEVQHGDTAATVAQKVFEEMAAAPGQFENVILERNSVLYSHQTNGKKDKQVTPADQHQLAFTVDVRTPGRIGTLLEAFELMKMDSVSRFSDGTTQYFKDAINQRSKYISVGDASVPLSRSASVMAGGEDDYDASLIAAIQRYSNAEKMNVNALIAAVNNVSEQKAYLDLPETRGDCMCWASPMMSDVVNNPDNEMADVLEWRTIETNRETSYNFLDNNWALVYDKYNDTDRWIPCCGGTAGLWARTATKQDPWISPAGHERGRFKNYKRLAWSPDKPKRDEMYKVGVNSIVDFPAEGILLYGDKTSLSRPSAFDRINVRQAFIVAEKSIANFAKYYLFELNDAFTRSSFVNAVRPFLRNMQSRRAFEAFSIVVDERNNGPEIRTANKMQGTFFIRPLYSINFIALNFAAVKPGVEFTEVENSMFG